MANKVTKSKVSKVQSKKVAKPKVIAAKKIEKKTPSEQTKVSGLTVKVFDTAGKSAGTTTLPKEFFGQKPNKSLLSQALHIYFTNSSTHTAHTKTRAEVRGGGRKPWRQKGTGRARAGSSRSPLWIGGGRSFGPKYRDVKLSLPTKMRKRALISALSQKAIDGNIKVISNLEKIQPKTKSMASLLAKVEAKSPVLIITSPDNKNIKLASRNIQKTLVNTPNNLNAYEIIKNRELLITKEALTKFV